MLLRLLGRRSREVAVAQVLSAAVSIKFRLLFQAKELSDLELSRQASDVLSLDHLLKPTSLKKLEKLLQKHDFWPLDQALDERGADAIEQLLRGAGFWRGAARLMREDVLLLVRALAEKAQADREKFARAQEMLIADHPMEFKRVRRYVVSASTSCCHSAQSAVLSLRQHRHFRVKL